jgi:hypothetical protein
MLGFPVAVVVRVHLRVPDPPPPRITQTRTLAFPAPGIYIDVPRPNKRDVEERQSVCQCDTKAAVGCPDDCVNRYVYMCKYSGVLSDWLPIP